MPIYIPNDDFGVEDILALFKHVDAQSKGDKAPREAVRFVHWPYQDFQQEGIDDGELYQQLKKITSQIMKRFAEDNFGETLALDKIADWREQQKQPALASNLFTILRPLLTHLIYEMLFERKLSNSDAEIYIPAVDNFHDTIKRTTLRSKRKRVHMRDAIRRQVEANGLFGDGSGFGADPALLTQHLGTTFFYTAIIQCTEYISHTLAAIAQNPEVFAALQPEIDTPSYDELTDSLKKCSYFDQVLKESLRMYPVFGHTTRQAARTLTVNKTTFEKGTVVSLDFEKCHKLHWENPEVFRPERWDDTSSLASSRTLRSSHYMPFGVGPRSCPAHQMATGITRAVVAGFLRHADVLVPKTFTHTRFIPLGVPVVLGFRNWKPSGPSHLKHAPREELVTRMEGKTIPRIERDLYECESTKTTFIRMLKNPQYLKAAGIHFMIRCLVGVQLRLTVRARNLFS